MTPLVKVGVIGGALTSLAGAGYASTYLFSYPTEKISDLIAKEDLYILLKTEDNQDTNHWTTKWESYKKENLNNTNDVFGLKGWRSDGTANVTEELKKKCANLKDSLVYGSGDTLYKNVTSYCGRAITVEDEANKDNKLTVINTEGDTASSDWSQKESDKSTLKPHIEKLGMTFGGIDAGKIKEGCKTAKTKNKVENQDYSRIYESYKAVCTKTA